MNLNEIYPSKFLRGADLGGKSALVVIERVEMDSFYDSERRENVQKPVLFFKGKNKGVVLSKTLAYGIADIVGSEDTDTWVGKTIILYSEHKLVYGNQKDVLCVRDRATEE
jgi:hypothetical protein